MFEPKILLLFCCRCLLAYTLLIVPWPGLNEAYSRVLRGVGNIIFFQPQSSGHVVLFKPNGGQESLPITTQIWVVNRHLQETNQSGPAKEMDLDTRFVCLAPAALVIALILATPISWVRRGWALFFGLFCLHGFIFFSIAVWCLREPDDGPTGLALVVLSPFWKVVVDHLTDFLLNEVDLMSFIPVIIWIFVTFTGQNMAKLWNRASHQVPSSALHTATPTYESPC